MVAGNVLLPENVWSVPDSEIWCYDPGVALGPSEITTILLQRTIHMPPKIPSCVVGRADLAGQLSSALNFCNPLFIRRPCRLSVPLCLFPSVFVI